MVAAMSRTVGLTLLVAIGVATASAEPLVVDLQKANREAGLRQVDGGDGVTVADSIGGRECRRTDLSWLERPGYRCFVYFDVDDAVIQGGRRPVAITVEFYDSDRGRLRLEYDAPGDRVATNFTPIESMPGQRTGQWQRSTFLVPDAEFANGANGRDFRLRSTSGDLYLSRVEVEELTRAEYETRVADQDQARAAALHGRAERIERAEAALLRGAETVEPPFETVTLMCGALLSTQVGPWDGLRAPAPDSFASWQRVIEYAAANGFTRIFAGGVVGSGWEGKDPDYMHVVDWTKTAFPEAALLPPERIAENIAAANRVLDAAAEAGIEVFLHNYHFSAPAALVDKHADITGTVTADSPIATNVDWALPTYQRWLETAWREQFKAMPNLTGRHDTMGEMVFGIDDKNKAAEEFTRLYARVHREMGRKPAMRNWWMHRCHRWIADDIEHRVDPDIHYVMKFSHTDSVTRKPDRELADWVEAGLSMSSNVQYPGENARFFLWADPGFVLDTVRTSRDIGMRGMTLGRGGPSFGVGAINDRAFIAYATGQLPMARFDRARWEQYLGTLLGCDGAQVLRAVELYSEGIRSISRIVGEPAEGFDMQYTHFLPPRKWMSTLGFGNANPPAEWREGICPFLEILEHLQDPSANWRDDIDRYVAGERISPMSFLARRAEDAAEGAAILDTLKAEDAEQLGLLQDNAHAVAIYLAYWEKLLWARARYEAIIRNTAGESSGDVLEACIEGFDECIAMLEQVAELVPGSGPATELANRRAERSKLREGLAELSQWYARDGWRVEAERLDVNADGEAAGYYIDLNSAIIRLGPPGVYPFEPYYEGWVTYSFDRSAGRYELRVEYQDDRDDPPDTEARLELRLNDAVVLTWALNANDDQMHTRSVTLDLKPGDVLKLSGRSDRTGNDFCRVDRLWLAPVD